jgi:hypothetical protein
VTRVRWERLALGTQRAIVGRAWAWVCPEPGTGEWRVDIRVNARLPWTTWRKSERGAKAAAVKLARRLGGRGG